MSDPTNTDAATVDTDAQTTSDAAGFEYPDGSKPEVDADGNPILEDRSADFPDEAAEAVEVIGTPLIQTRDGRLHSLGHGSGMSGYRGLAAKRAEKAAARVAPDTDEEREAALALAAEAGIDADTLVDDDGQWLSVSAIHERIASEQGQDSGQEAPEGSGTTDDTSEVENGPETGDQDSSTDTDESGDAGADEGSGEDVEEAGSGEPVTDAEPESETEVADAGFDPTAHTVVEVQAYLSENPDQATYVLDRERTGKARTTLIGA